MLPSDPFRRTRLPAEFDRVGRVRLLREAAAALLRGELPSDEARLFLAGGLSSWLAEGGRVGALERDFFKVSPCAGSKRTPAVIARELDHESLPPREDNTD